MDSTHRHRRHLGKNELKHRINTHRQYSGRRFNGHRPGNLVLAHSRQGNVISLLNGTRHLPFWKRLDLLCYIASLLVAMLVICVTWSAL